MTQISADVVTHFSHLLNLRNRQASQNRSPTEGGEELKNST
jgi:hypothetical protein